MLFPRAQAAVSWEERGSGQQYGVRVSREDGGTAGLSRPLFAFAPKAALGQLWVPSTLWPLHPGLPPWAPSRTPPLSTLMLIPGCRRQLRPRGLSPAPKGTNFVVYRSVSGLRANLGRRPTSSIFLSFSSSFWGLGERAPLLSRESHQRKWNNLDWQDLKDSVLAKRQQERGEENGCAPGFIACANLWILVWGWAVNYKHLSRCTLSKSSYGNNGWGKEVRKLLPET